MEPQQKISRRRVLRGVGGVTAGGLVLAACAGRQPTVGTSSPPRLADGPERLAYGRDPSQFAELHRPTGESRGVVVVIHGGFWLDAFDLTLGTPLALDLAGLGWTALNIEYRRVGNGGGVPATLDDVAAAIDLLADARDLDLDTVVTLGHSAGGHLAAWAAARGRFDAWQPVRVPVTHVVAQAGVLDLRSGYQDQLGNGAVEAFLGHPPTDVDDAVDPFRQIPLDQPMWCVHGVDDPIVPLSQSQGYVTAAVAAGAAAELVQVTGDHFVLIDPASQAWVATVDVLDGIAPA